MPITRNTREQRREIAENIKSAERLNERRKKLYIRIYKKGWLYRSTFSIRIVYLTVLIVALFFDDTLSTQRKETVKSVFLDHLTYHSKTRSSHSVTTLEFSTENDDYEVYDGISNLQKGDKVIIERNLFGKPIYYMNLSAGQKYEIDISRMYYIIFFTTAVSFLLIGGIDKAARKFLVIISIIDILALAAYLFT